MLDIILVDDHPVVRSGVKCLLDNTGDINVVAETDNVNEAYELHLKHDRALMLLDIDLPNSSSLTLLGQMIARDAHAKIIMFSGFEEPSFAVQSIAAGAKGYLLKSSSESELLQAIRQVAMNKPYLSQDVAQEIALQKLRSEQNPMDSLTHREFEVFRLLAGGTDINAIAEQLKVGEKTVFNYQTRLKHKLNISNPIQLLRLALKHRVITMQLSLLVVATHSFA